MNKFYAKNNNLNKKIKKIKLEAIMKYYFLTVILFEILTFP